MNRFSPVCIFEVVLADTEKHYRFFVFCCYHLTELLVFFSSFSVDSLWFYRLILFLTDFYMTGSCSLVISSVVSLQKCLSWLKNFTSCLCLLSSHYCSLMIFSMYLLSYIWTSLTRPRASFMLFVMEENNDFNFGYVVFFIFVGHLG